MIYLVAIIFPWLAFMLKGRLGLGLLCLLLQITLIGWLPATIWAIVVINNIHADERHQEMMRNQQQADIYSKPKEYLTIEEKARLFDERNS